MLWTYYMNGKRKIPQCSSNLKTIPPMTQACSWLLILPLSGQCHFMQRTLLLFPSGTEVQHFNYKKRLPPLFFKGPQYACVVWGTTGIVFIIISSYGHPILTAQSCREPRTCVLWGADAVAVTFLVHWPCWSGCGQPPVCGEGVSWYGRVRSVEGPLTSVAVASCGSSFGTPPCGRIYDGE